MGVTHPILVTATSPNECPGGIKHRPSSPLPARPEELNPECPAVTSSRKTNCGGSRFGNAQVYDLPQGSNVPSSFEPSGTLIPHLTDTYQPTEGRHSLPITLRKAYDTHKGSNTAHRQSKVAPWPLD
jgi:hypothetical protein